MLGGVSDCSCRAGIQRKRGKPSLFFAAETCCPEQKQEAANDLLPGVLARQHNEGPRPDSRFRSARRKDDGTLLHHPGVRVLLLFTQIRDNSVLLNCIRKIIRDAGIVAHGHKPTVLAARSALPTAKGRPVNTNLARLPYSYILQTLADF